MAEPATSPTTGFTAAGQDLPRAGIAHPRTAGETGLRPEMLDDLTLKHLLLGGVLDLQQLSARLTLSATIVESVLGGLRKEGQVEVRGAAGGGALRYALTERGRASGLAAKMRSGYTGPAPVPLEAYSAVVAQQSIHTKPITRTDMQNAFSDIVISDLRLDQLGPALNSGRAVLVYGLAGTGKTYTCQRLPRVLGDSVYVPHAITVGDEIVQYFDGVLHKPIEQTAEIPSPLLSEGYDRRYVECRRPVAISGGELTLDMLEIEYDAANRLNFAPTQLKANNGIYIIDDLGRQRVEPVDLFNRWIVPLEERLDYLTLGTGKRFPVPFDVILIFSTNIHPTDLADAAFLRRIGYKIEFTPSSETEFQAIWQRCCAERSLEPQPQVVEAAMTLYRGSNRALLACHPRDLIGLMLDRCRFLGEPARLTTAGLRTAWDMYFVSNNGNAGDKT